MSDEKMQEIIVAAETSLEKASPEDVGGRTKLKKEMIRRHHDGYNSLWEKIKAEGFLSNEKFIQKLMEEQLGETDNLTAYGEVLYQDGEIRDAAAIAAKRIESIQSVIKTVQVKQQIEKEMGSGVDVYSPSMAIVFRYFLNKVKGVFEAMGADVSFTSSFFQKFVADTQNWPVELQMELEKFSVITPDDDDLPAQVVYDKQQEGEENGIS